MARIRIMDKDLHQLYSIPVKMMLEKTKNKYFFTQEEFEENYGKLMILSNLRNKIEKRLEEKEKKLA